MQSKTTRGLRRLLVSTGVISLVLSVAAPAALAGQPEGVEEKKNDRATGEHTSDPIVVDDADPSTVGKVWVCHENNGTKEVNLIEVSDNSVDHGDDKGGHEYGERMGDLTEALTPLDVDLPALQATMELANPTKADLRILAPLLCETPVATPPANDVVVGGTGGDQSGNNGVGDGVGGGQSGNNGVGDGVGGGQSGNNGVGDGVGGGQSGNNGVGDGVGGGQSGNGGSEGTGGQSGTNDGDDSTDTSSDEPKKETIISTVTVTRPAPAVPATPTVPATPATPQAPATPAAPAVANAPTAPATPAPSVVVSSTSRGNEVLGSITTRTPGGARVTALAATGTSTTVALAALGAVLLLAGLGLQAAARRVESSPMGA